MRKLPRQRQCVPGNRSALPTLGHLARPAVERKDAGAERLAVAVEQIDAIAMSRGCDADHVGCRPAAFTQSLGYRFRRRLPEPQEIPLHMARFRHRLGQAPSRGGERNAALIEDDGFGDGQAIVDAE